MANPITQEDYLRDLRVVPTRETPQQKAARDAYANYVANPRPSFNDLLQGRARETGWAANNRWLVLLFPNDWVQGFIGYHFITSSTRLAVTCKSITMNDQSWYTTELSMLNGGPSRVLPYKRNTTNSSGIKIQWNLGADMYEKQLFEEWLRAIQNPYTYGIRYYDDYAKGSSIYLILLPNHVQDFDQVISAIAEGKVVGYQLTEAYPYSININGGALNYNASQEPMFVDVGFMFHDVVPLIGANQQRATQTVPMITDSGYPVIDKDRWDNTGFLRKSQEGLDAAVNGFALGTIAERGAFNALRQNQHSILRQYTQQLQTYKNTEFPRAVDGKVVYSTPKTGALDLGLNILQQTQGFLGAGFFGNGFFP